MVKKLRTCSCCLNKYQYCPQCNSDKNKPTWMFTFCSINCKNIYNTTSQFENGQINANIAKEQLDKLDLSNLNNFGTSYKNSIRKIINSAKNDVDISEATNNKTTETFDNDVVEDKSIKKPKNKMAKNVE